TEFKRDAYTIVRDLPALERYVARALEVGAVGIDTEADCFDAARAQLVGIALSLGANDAIYVPLGHRGADPRAGALFANEHPDAVASAGDSGPQIALPSALAVLKPLLEDASVLKIGLNVKWDIALFAKHGVTLAPYDDPMLISYALYGGLDDHAKASLIEKHLGHQVASLADVIGKGKAQIGFEAAPVEKAAIYSAE